MLISEILQESTDALDGAGIDTPALDAELLLCHCLGLSRTDLYLNANDAVSSRLFDQFHSLLNRRVQREPLAYILGVQEFWSIDFVVTPNVLIPRPETEQLLETVIAFDSAKQLGDGLIVDLCCGSGAIAVVLAKELQRKVLAIDISFEALLVAKNNCEKHGVSHLVSLVQSDLLSTLPPLSNIACVVSNPPYVSRQEMKDGMQPEVLMYEPHLALDGGENGLEIIRRIRQQLYSRLAAGGHLFMETGTEQAQALYQMFTRKNAEQHSFSDVSVQKDYAGHDRIFHAKMNTPAL